MSKTASQQVDDGYEQLSPVERQLMLQLDMEQQQQDLPGKDSVVEYLDKISKTPIRIEEHLEELPWLNTTRPLALKHELDNLIIACDFFTYCCINCLHMLPFLAITEQRYANREVVIIGVHSPKFENEKSLKKVADAIIRHDIRHAVCNDSELKLWHQMGIGCWPTVTVIGPGAQLLFTLTGEVAIRKRLEHYLDISLEYYKNQLDFQKKASLPLSLLREQLKRSEQFFSYPTKVALSTDGKKIAVADTLSHAVIVCSTAGVVHHRIGGSQSGFQDGLLVQALFNYPQGIAWIDEETFYVCDTENHALRRVDLVKKMVATVAGNGTMGDDKIGGRVGFEQSLNSPWDLVFEPVDRRLYIAMAGLHQIWTMILSPDGDNIHGSHFPYGACLCFAGDGNEQKRNHRSAVKASFAQPSGICLLSRVLYVADSESSSVRTVDIDSGTVGTLVGGSVDPTDLFAFGDVDGKSLLCRLQHCMGICTGSDGNTLFLADTFNHKVKKINVETKTCEQIPVRFHGENQKFDEPNGLCWVSDESMLLVADTNNHRLVSVSMAENDFCAKIFDLVELNEEEEKPTECEKTDADGDSGKNQSVIEQDMLEMAIQNDPEPEAEIIVSIGFTGDEMLKAAPGAHHRIRARTTDPAWQVEPPTMVVEALKDIRFLVRCRRGDQQPPKMETTTLILEFSLNLCHSVENYCLLRTAIIRQPIRLTDDQPEATEKILFGQDTLEYTHETGIILPLKKKFMHGTCEIQTLAAIRIMITNKSSGLKKVFKEKVVLLYSSLIKDDEPEHRPDNFWNEFFLLKANGGSLEQELKKIDDDDVDRLRRVVGMLFEKSLDAIQDHNQLRIVNGLITLCIISHHVLFTLKNHQSSDELFVILTGDLHQPKVVNKLVETICSLLFDEEIHHRIKSISLRLLLILASAAATAATNTTANDDSDENCNSSGFLEYFMSYNLFDALVEQLNDASQSQDDNLRVFLLLNIFLNYKQPNTNPYVMKLSIVDDEISLNMYIKTITNQLIKFNQLFDQLNPESKSGLFSSLSNMVGTIFSNSNEDSNHNTMVVNISHGTKLKKMPFQMSLLNLVLLSFYEAVSLNRNFISLLITTSLESLSGQTDGNGGGNATAVPYGPPPPNLLVAFLEFSSAVMLEMKDEATMQTARLCFIILTCITEDSSANAIIHDNNMAFIVNLKRMPMRHRKLPIERTKGVRPICHTILDLMMEFILAHMNRQTSQESFLFCLGIIHRLLCFQKRCRIRIQFDWKELWSALIKALKFLLNNEQYFLKHQWDLFTVARQIVSIFNMFILYGDHFLYSDICYDELYYEIIRMHTVFDNLNSLALRHMTKEGQNGPNNFKEAANKLTNSLINIKAIIAHLNAKLELYSSHNKIVTLSEEQVLEVVRNNYDSLTLKIPENLDSYEPYYSFAHGDNGEMKFFRQILSDIQTEVVGSRQWTAVTGDEQHDLIQDIQRLIIIHTGGSNIITGTTTTTKDRQSPLPDQN